MGILCGYLCVCVCVRKREREREREKDGWGEKDILAKVFRESSLSKDIKYVTNAEKKLCDDRFK